MSRRRRVPVLLGIPLLLGLLSGHVHGQVLIERLKDPSAGRGVGQAEMVHVTDRRLTQRLLQARDLVRKGESGAAIALLQSLLLHEEDSFFREPGPDGELDPLARFSSLKLIASQLLGTLDPAGRRAYELKYGITARQMLKRARAGGGGELLEQIARQYFHTVAGREAAEDLGTYYLDRGQSLMAAMRFEQLRAAGATASEPMLSIKTALAWARSGQVDRGVAVLAALTAVSRAELSRRGGPLADALGSRAATRRWLADAAAASRRGAGGLSTAAWMAWRGNRSRTGSAGEAVPGRDPEWVFPTFQRELDDPRRQQRLQAARDELPGLAAAERARNGLLLPAVDPLVIGDIAVFRSLFDIKAVHLPSGRHLWDTVTLDPAFDRILDGNVPSFTVRGRNQLRSLTSLFLAQRAWHDRTIGTLSTDGRYIFAVDEVGVIGMLSRTNRFRQASVADWVPRDYNRLLAFELASEGKLVWELGGPPGGNLGGSFFLGPPLPLGDRLYTLVERDGEIRLWALAREGESVAVDWSQGIAEPELTVLMDNTRRMAGLSPSFSDGVLVCPTEAGLVVAVDLARRLLLWSYPYRTVGSPNNLNRQQLMQLRMARLNGMLQDASADGWFDSAPIIAEGCVLLTPRDSNQLHCLRLEDGRLLWSRPREHGCFVAAVHEGRVAVVGRSRIQSFRLTDGTSAWTMPTAIPRPTGVGVRVGSRYHLPVAIRMAVSANPTGNTPAGSARTTRGAIITLDLETGRLLARTENGQGRLVGNLVGAQGRLLALGHDELVGFVDDGRLQQRIEAQLADDPGNAAALALRGRRRLHRGEFDAAVRDLEASFDKLPDPKVRRLLVQALLDGMQYDYARYARHAHRLESLLDSPDEQLAYRRLRAGGLAGSGKSLEAFEEYLKLNTPPPAAAVKGPQLEPIGEDLAVQRARWIAGRLAAVFAAATPPQQKVLSAKIETLLEAAAGRGGTESLEHFVALFDGHPSVDRGRRLILARLPDTATRLNREALLLALRGSAAPRFAGRATAELVELWGRQKRSAALQPLVKELATGRFADVEVAAGRKGRDQVADWRADPAFASVVSPPPEWYPGRVQSTRSVNEQRRTSVNTYPVPFSGRRPAAWRGWTFRLDNRRQYVIAHDGSGVERWRLTTVGDLAVPDSSARVPYAFEGNYVQAVGHLLLVVLGNRFAVIDGLGDDQQPHVLWARNLYEGRTGIQPRVIRLGNPVVGGPRWFKMTDPTGRPIGRVGTLVAGLLTYQVGTVVQAADPITGTVLWSREGIRRGSRLYGTGKYVFVEPLDRREVLVLDAADGRAIATRTLTSEAETLARIGRFVVSRTLAAGKQLLSCRDLVSGKLAWTTTLAGDLRPVTCGQNALAVLESNGRFAVLEIASGRTLIDAALFLAPVEKLDDVTSFYVFETTQRYIVLVNRSSSVRVRGTSSRAVPIHGQAWGFLKAAAARSKKPLAKAVWGPVTIEHQAIELDQPKHLPVLTFVSRVYRPVQNALNPRPRTEYGVLVLDQRNGRIVYRENGTIPVSAMKVQADPAQQKIRLEFYRSSIDLQFTNDSLPDTPRPDKTP